MIAAGALAILMASCASGVAPVTLAAIIQVESGANELAIHDNTTGQTVSPATAADAATAADRLIGQGHSVDLGLGQINSRNLGQLGMTAADAFDPCTNLKGMGTILATSYGAALRVAPGSQSALRMALSAYNTGNWGTGFANGYVQKVVDAAGSVPAIDASQGRSSPSVVSKAAPWDVFHEYDAVPSADVVIADGSSVPVQ